MKEYRQKDIAAALVAYFEKRGLFALNIKEYLYNYPDATVFADDGDDIGVLMINDQGSEMFLFDCLSPELIPKADDLIRSYPYIAFSGTDYILSEELKKRYSSELFWENVCDMYYYDGKEPPTPKKTDGVIGRIRVKDVKTVNDNYTYRHKGTKKALLHDIKQRENVAMFKDGKIVSWVLLHPDNSLGVMFTLPEHRGKNYAQALASTLIGKVMMTGNIPYVHIVVGNTASDALAISCGMKPAHRVSWLGFKTKACNK